MPEPIEFDADGESLCQLNEIQLLAGHTDIVRVMVRIDENRSAIPSLFLVFSSTELIDFCCYYFLCTAVCWLHYYVIV